MKARYQVEVETIIVTPLIVDADSADEAIILVMNGQGEAGQSWYEQPEKPKVKALGRSQP